MELRGKFISIPKRGFKIPHKFLSKKFSHESWWSLWLRATLPFRDCSREIVSMVTNKKTHVRSSWKKISRAIYAQTLCLIPLCHQQREKRNLGKMKRLNGSDRNCLIWKSITSGPGLIKAIKECRKVKKTFKNFLHFFLQFDLQKTFTGFLIPSLVVNLSQEEKYNFLFNILSTCFVLWIPNVKTFDASRKWLKLKKAVKWKIFSAQRKFLNDNMKIRISLFDLPRLVYQRFV